MVELFEHTADLGIRAAAPDLPGLFALVSRGLTMASVEDADSVEPRDGYRFSIYGSDRDYLLFDLLREQLRRTEMEGVLTAAVEVVFTDAGLDVLYRGEPIDPARHALSHEVKAITYHGLQIAEIDGVYVAEVIVDI